MAKGNDGRGRRKRNQKNIMYIGGSIGAFLLIAAFVSRKSGGSSSKMNDEDHRRLKYEQQKKLLREAKQKRYERGDTTEQVQKRRHQERPQRPPPPGYPPRPPRGGNDDDEIDEEGRGRYGGHGGFRPPPPPGYPGYPGGEGEYGEHGQFPPPPGQFPPPPGYAGNGGDEYGGYVPVDGGQYPRRPGYPQQPFRPPPPPGFGGEDYENEDGEEGEYPPRFGFGAGGGEYPRPGYAGADVGQYMPPPPPPGYEDGEYPEYAQQPPQGWQGGAGGYAGGQYGQQPPPPPPGWQGGAGYGGEAPLGPPGGGGPAGGWGNYEEEDGEAEDPLEAIYGAGQHGYDNNKKKKKHGYRGGAGLASPNDNANTEQRNLQHLKQVDGITEQELNTILSSEVHLVDLFIPPDGNIASPFGLEEDYSEMIMAEFCVIEWGYHKEDPSKVPMFRDLVKKSSDCKHKISVSLKQITDAARSYDRNNREDISSSGDDDANAIENLIPDIPGGARPLKAAGFVFHESRCGSTLVANTLAAMDPATHRVYSESPPPLKALTACEDDFSRCSKSVAAELFRDAIYMMSRTNEEEEKNVFFKIQSIGSRFINVFLEAFPDTPWMFVYREPNQVMMSQLDVPKINQANCVRARRHPTPFVKEFVQRHGLTLKELSDEDFCAVHLATICEGATNALDTSTTGRAVNYSNLLPSLMDDIFPNHFQIPVGNTERQRIEQVSGHYSKARNAKTQEWKGDDSEQKERRATEEMKSASEKFLMEVYDKLETYQ